MGVITQIMKAAGFREMNKYNESHDEQGRFSSGGGGGAWNHHSTVGEVHPYELQEGSGTVGGQWRVKEKGVSNPEVKTFDSKQEALDHIHNSQDDD